MVWLITGRRRRSPPRGRRPWSPETNGVSVARRKVNSAGRFGWVEPPVPVVLRIAGLVHEVVDDPEEGAAVVEAGPGQFADPRHRCGRRQRAQLDDDPALVGVDDQHVLGIGRAPVGLGGRRRAAAAGGALGRRAPARGGAGGAADEQGEQQGQGESFIGAAPSPSGRRRKRRGHLASGRRPWPAAGGLTPCGHEAATRRRPW